MAFAVKIQDVQDYRDILPAPGKYEAEIIKAKEGKTRQGGPGSRGKIDLTFKILDTYPNGLSDEIDTDEYENPIDNGMQFSTIYMVADHDAKNTVNMFTGRLRDWLANFNVEPEDENSLSDTDFMDCVGGVVIKHEKRDKKDPNSPIVARIEVSCNIED